MRDLKFRIWNKDKKMWCPDDQELEYLANGCLVLKPDRKNVIIQQFTGLLDKNGKEIYEGDILLVKQPNCREFKQDIQFKTNGFWLEDSFEGNFLPNQEFIEVIGNIFENPELLN